MRELLAIKTVLGELEALAGGNRATICGIQTAKCLAGYLFFGWFNFTY